MSDDFVTPVKGIIKALDTGIRLTKKIAKTASSPPSAQGQQIQKLAQNLQKSLEKSSQAIVEGYRQNDSGYGQQFTKALIEDRRLIRPGTFVYC
jgi:hypothetical protein